MKAFLTRYWKNGCRHDRVDAIPARSNERSSSGQLDRDSHGHPCKKGSSMRFRYLSEQYWDLPTQFITWSTKATRTFLVWKRLNSVFFNLRLIELLTQQQ